MEMVARPECEICHERVNRGQSYIWVVHPVCLTDDELEKIHQGDPQPIAAGGSAFCYHYSCYNGARKSLS